MSELDYAHLQIEGQSLLMPRADIRHIELVDKLQAPGPGEVRSTMLATLEHEGQQWPVFTLDDTLRAMDELPETRRFVACMATGDRMMALACESVSRFQLQGDYLLDTLPSMMRAQRTPLQSLLYNEGRLYYVTSADALVSYLLKGGL